MNVKFSLSTAFENLMNLYRILKTRVQVAESSKLQRLFYPFKDHKVSIMWLTCEFN